MSTELKVRIGIIIILIGAALYCLFPTYRWYTTPSAERDRLERAGDKIMDKTLNLGLDLRGGSHLILELDESKLEKKEKLTDAIERAIEIIRNRVDQFGVREPLIVRQGEKWIVVQLPGLKDPEAAKSLIGKTALLEFRLVNDTGAIQKIDDKRRELNLLWDEIYISSTTQQLRKEFLPVFPTGYVLMAGKNEQYYLVKSSPELTGAYLVDAKVEFGGEYNLPIVNIEFNRDGAKLFSATTGLNINRNLAIVLDNIVQSAPVIRSKIPDGRAIIEGNFTLDEAKNLSIILRAGALPAPVYIVEERTVGPSLGQDSIKWGTYAALLGFILILIFMGVYYQFSGMIANIALILNLLMLMGIMAYFHFTLTLPGIAGVILSIGMAVDANVLIFERIREELRNGKTIRVAIDQGYGKAFWTIFDSNLTTLAAAIFLFQFGTGPIKGFAVTLTIGIMISMFTAIVVTKVIYELALKGRTVTKLSI
ncbi:MAG: protein translocase subunit SecD [Elusimicrobiota bacterium]